MKKQPCKHRQFIVGNASQISSFVLYWEPALCYVHTCPTLHCRHPRELVQRQTDWGEDSQELCWHWGTACVCEGGLIVSPCIKQTNHTSKYVPTAIGQVGPTSWGSYCPLGLVAARMVHLVFSLHTRPACMHQQYTHHWEIRPHITTKTWCLYLVHEHQVQYFYTQYSHMSRTYTLATLMVCCSMASWMLALSCSRMLLNSSSGGWEVCITMFYSMKKDVPLPMQQRPPSASTRAPASNCHSPLSWGEKVVKFLCHCTIAGDIAICPVYMKDDGCYPHTCMHISQHLASIGYVENS